MLAKNLSIYLSIYCTCTVHIYTYNYNTRDLKKLRENFGFLSCFLSSLVNWVLERSGARSSICLIYVRVRMYDNVGMFPDEKLSGIIDTLIFSASAMKSVQRQIDFAQVSVFQASSMYVCCMYCVVSYLLNYLGAEALWLCTRAVRTPPFWLSGHHSPIHIPTQPFFSFLLFSLLLQLSCLLA